jgi:hypothetical protein
MVPPIEWPITLSRVSGGTERIDELGDVRDVIDEVVVETGGEPCAFAEAAEIGREDAVPVRGECARDAIPRRRRIEETVEKHHRALVRASRRSHPREYAWTPF